MSDIKNIKKEKAIEKLAHLVADIEVCMFGTEIHGASKPTIRPMNTQKVCDKGYIWFLSAAGSGKNKEVEKNNNVQLSYSHPGKDLYVTIKGKAEILRDKKIVEELWKPSVKVWFPKGKSDPNITVIKVKPTHAYYWDKKGSKEVSFLKMLASVALGNKPRAGKEGQLAI